jgi:hypothetical protein
MALWCIDIKETLLCIPGIHKFAANMNFITEILTKYVAVIIGVIVTWGIVFWRKYADVKVPSITIAGIEFNLKNIDGIVKSNLANYLVTKRSLFKINVTQDNFDDVFESYHSIYEFIRLQMSYYENVSTTKNDIYLEMKSMLKDLNRFLTANQTNYRRWYKFESEKQYKFIDELQKEYPQYDELVQAFLDINTTMLKHMSKLDIEIEW